MTRGEFFKRIGLGMLAVPFLAKAKDKRFEPVGTAYDPPDGGGCIKINDREVNQFNEGDIIIENISDKLFFVVKPGKTSIMFWKDWKLV